ncbi:50S ribosomal protein L3 [Candidatus Woesebacteria bacterium RIFCSPHIGHO2_01_FULL_39_32]|uniref:Large ribosomal subunit protein uL3 n=2 Tax=Candidatus Woeseibacteriota TaxID=1752722 RepID=A0A0G0PQU7_9BACT|nr:MAG: 50S ribosomal protein L3 [Candidatus Woesebacteria bacterium GW2011_GWA1_39_8]OGM04919.1 MAG: 50S ribosomal protein L3 [Candidatus Woesebacteria bacterium GWB1_37_5]OGM24736.1 MAG: 50S ribosomal protein L3 [Candidatus Woesebacteria bacterium RIFCSPHIGHO2_01_FULL_39_32]OGM38191.1 MAG: 50S ribosomal protein L3 [Candidatus Woesebacteria bacterium RIFCSPHIGHO2_12_FULL_38_11]OGM64562.1 MAG: 50S ribosomal protein L3 [Candidatus Woesebacteria bacterium RIFCSPLOWO2_01_FULL_39_25]
MLNTILGSKQKMSQTFVEGTRVAVTWIKVGPCVVTQIKNIEKDGYWAVQLGFGNRNLKNTSKPLQGHLRKSTQNSKFKIQNKMPRFLREVRLDSEPEFKVGDIISVSDVFKKGDVIAITGTSKGKGFAGVVKRWGFHGGPRTHGQSDRERAPGSIGQGTTPGRVLKGKKMAGRMGGDRVTVKNLIVVDVDKEAGLIAVSGPVPGVPGGLLIIKKLAEGSLEELVEEAPQVEIQQVEPSDADAMEGNGEAGSGNDEKTEGKKE